MTNYESFSLLAAYLNLIASFGALGLLYYGIRMMARGAEMRAVGSDRKHSETMTESGRRHNEVMTESQRRHSEAMEASRRREEEGLRRHEEAMEDIRRRDEEGIRRHEEAMATLSQSRDALRELIDGQAESRMALRELIVRTG